MSYTPADDCLVNNITNGSGTILMKANDPLVWDQANSIMSIKNSSATDYGVITTLDQTLGAGTKNIPILNIGGGSQTISSISTDKSLSSSSDSILPTQNAIKNYVDNSKYLNNSWQQHVKQFYDASVSLPIAPIDYDRFICSNSGNGWIKKYVYMYLNLAWSSFLPIESSTVYIDDLNTIWTYDGSNWVTTAITGATGAIGATGPTGLNGSTGPTGSNGLNGSTGPTGPTGLNGTNGINGLNGSTGPTGLNGTNGTNGLNGSTGPTGSTGPQGIQGIQGIQGVIGSTGPQGIQGVTGSTGPTSTVQLETIVTPQMYDNRAGTPYGTPSIDTASIQWVINQCISNNKCGYIPAAESGYYFMNDNLTITTVSPNLGFKLYGDGQQKSTIFFLTGFNLSIASTGNIYNVSISDIAFYGIMNAGPILKLGDDAFSYVVANSEFRNMTIYNTSTASGAIGCQLNYVSNSTFINMAINNVASHQYGTYGMILYKTISSVFDGCSIANWINGLALLNMSGGGSSGNVFNSMSINSGTCLMINDLGAYDNSWYGGNFTFSSYGLNCTQGSTNSMLSGPKFVGTVANIAQSVNGIHVTCDAGQFGTMYAPNIYLNTAKNLTLASGSSGYSTLYLMYNALYSALRGEAGGNVGLLCGAGSNTNFNVYAGLLQLASNCLLLVNNSTEASSSAGAIKTAGGILAGKNVYCNGISLSAGSAISLLDYYSFESYPTATFTCGGSPINTCSVKVTICRIGKIVTITLYQATPITLANTPTFYTASSMISTTRFLTAGQDICCNMIVTNNNAISEGYLTLSASTGTINIYRNIAQQVFQNGISAIGDCTSGSTKAVSFSYVNY